MAIFWSILARGTSVDCFRIVPRVLDHKAFFVLSIFALELSEAIVYLIRHHLPGGLPNQIVDK